MTTHRLIIDLTAKEQDHVRAALQFLRRRFDGWQSLAKVLRFKHSTLSNVAKGRTVSASLAFRIARLAAVPVDDLLAGSFPAPGTCPHCGHTKDEAA